MAVVNDAQHAQDQADAAAAIASIEAAAVPPPPPPAAAAPPLPPPAAMAAPPSLPAKVEDVIHPPQPLNPDAKKVGESLTEIDDIAREAQRRLAAEEERLAEGRRRRAAPAEPEPTAEPEAPLSPQAQATADKLEALGIDVAKMAEANGLSEAELAYIVTQQVQKKAGPWKPSHAGVAEELRTVKAELQQLREELQQAGEVALQQEEIQKQREQDQQLRGLESQRNENIRVAALQKISGPEFKQKYRHIALQDPNEMAKAVSSAFAQARAEKKNLTADQVFAWMESNLEQMARTFAPLYEKPAPVETPKPASSGQSAVSSSVSSATPVARPASPQPTARFAEVGVIPDFPEVRLQPGDDAEEIASILRGIQQGSIGR